MTSSTRRYFLGQGTGLSLGAMALDSLLANVPIDIAPKAKRVIFLTQSGGPSQIELFDHKPGLAKMAGQKLPDSVRNGQRLTGMSKGKPQLVMPSHASFSRYGE
ncbi:MAG: hypothetical protein ACI9UA_005153, partial [Pseudoalteromonas tetraodonis]